MNITLRTLMPLAFAALGLAPKAEAQTFIAGVTTTEQFFVANATTPGTPLFPPVTITGITAGQTIAGIDFRPRTGELFALGYNPINNEARLYTISQATGAASVVGATSITLPLGTGAIGFDFNPTVDLIRVISSNRANYRLSPITGAVAATDGTLTYAASDINSGATPNIGSGAYTNSYVASEATTLYDYDQSLNILVSQIPPNAGTLNTIGSTGLTVPAGATTDMDIVFDSASAQNRAYLSVSASITQPLSNLYTLDLGTGASTLVGSFGALNVKDIAVVIRRNVPANVTGRLIHGLTRSNRNLISFDSDNPGIIRKFTPVTGVVTGQRIVGMDVRPVDRKLYAMGYDEATDGYSLYTIDTGSGVATRINATPGTIALGGAGARIGFDFNPTVDKIRVSSNNTANFRLDPDNGAILFTDGNFKFITGDANAGRPARVGAVAYTRSFAGTTTTMLYAIDDSLGAILQVDTPNSGASRTVLANAFIPNGADATTDIDFFYDSTSTNDRGFLTLNTGSSNNDSLWTFLPNLTGQQMITPVGRIGLGVQVMDIAVQLQYTGPTSVRNISLLPGTDVYPNPAGETLFVRTSGSGTARAVVTDLAGRPVLIQTGTLGNTMSLNVGALPAGLYSLILESNGAVIGTAKIVKQ